MPTVITGKDCEVTFGPGLPAVIIGERINPTGRKKLASQLTSGNLDIVEKEAVSQKAAGADILDVNVGATDVKEEILLPLAVKKILEATGLPLCIDSANENPFPDTNHPLSTRCWPKGEDLARLAVSC